MTTITAASKTTRGHELAFSVASIIEDVLHQHGSHSSHLGLSSRRMDEVSMRRYEAAGWLRKTMGVVGGKDLAAEPSEEEFMLALRSGIILCSVLNKLTPGAIPKVVEGPSDCVMIPEGAPLSAFQYFENIRNFLVAVHEMGLPSFEASDLEQGGKSARVVNCVLALKSYSLWKQTGSNGSWKLGSPSVGRPFMRKNSDPFFNTLSWGDPSPTPDFVTQSPSARSLNALVHEVLSDKRQEEVPLIIESMLSKVVEEFERRLANQTDLKKAIPKDISLCNADRSLSKSGSEDEEIESRNTSQGNTQEEGSKCLSLKQHVLVEQQQRDIENLKHTLRDTKGVVQFLQRQQKEEFDNLGKHLQGLACAASGYQRVVEENRKLYNQVQDLKGNIRVYCRVRPFLAGQVNHSSTVENIDGGNITIISPAKYCKEGRKSFTFNKVFGPLATQEEVFADTRPLIRSALDGYNVCIFAYGQTGSGKTFTMSGPKEVTEESHGVNYRALHDLFVMAEERKESVSYEISVQMLEIYNEQVRDLLGSNKRLEVRNSCQKGMNVPEAKLVRVWSPPDVLSLMTLGLKNRAVGATAMNDRSSRSHSCLSVHVEGRGVRGCMHLVDLAGSERVDKSEVAGERLKEAQHINRSLSALGDVIAALALNNSHVPYRNTKLTQLLQHSLGGQAKTLMFVHVSPEPDAAGETLSTLKFAERVSTVELGAAKPNQDSADVKHLKDQIASLKAALARKEAEREARSRVPSSWRSLGERRQTVEDLANIQNSGSNLRRRNLDPQEMLLIRSESGSSDNWDDKIMLNKRDEDCWDVDSEVFGSSSLPDPPYDSDDQLEALWNLNPLQTPNAAAARKTQLTRDDTRSLIPSLIPSPPVSRRVSQLVQPSCRPVLGQAKRRTAK